MLKSIYGFIKEWVLIFAILGGVGGYFLYTAIPALEPTHPYAMSAVQTIQPLLLFAMLLISFSNINPRRLHLCPWHLWLLAFQAALFLLFGALAATLPKSEWRIIAEGAMLCFICPVATAGVVIVGKLGGNTANITTYTILINLLAAILIPLVVPLIHAGNDMSIPLTMLMIVSKVFPTLLLPMALAFLIRRFAPTLHHYLTHLKELPFTLWVVALMLSMAITTRFIMSSNTSLMVSLSLVAVALLSCIIQFAVGWHIGSRYGDRITAGQSLGQKNTVLAIWLGYSFFTPITSLAAGFYAIFHNLVNSYQLHRRHP